jgi:hypothetical protein
MLYREIIAICSEIHTKHINTLCGQNVELLNVKPLGASGIKVGIKRLRMIGAIPSLRLCAFYFPNIADEFLEGRF